MVSQFVSNHEVRLLGELAFSFPEGTHAIGRLDNMSEGLLILTTNKKITKLLFMDKTPHERTYLVKVRHRMKPESVLQLQNGVSIQVSGGGYYTTQPCKAFIIDDPKPLLASAGVEEKDDGLNNHTWLTLTLVEGKYHQVRKMVSALGHRCLRLIRLSIEDLQLAGLPAGEVREVQEEEFFRNLKIGA